MTKPKTATASAPQGERDGDDAAAEYVPFDEFRAGPPRGRFRVIVNRDLAQRFVAHRAHATPVAIALIGIGIACALGGYALWGGLLVAAGILFRRALKWKAGEIVLQLCSRQASTYHQALEDGVIEVQRV